MKSRVALIAVLASALGAQAASAHVTVNPNEAEAASFARFAIRVPTERPVATTAVRLRLPEGLFLVSFQPKPGWKRTVKMEQLAEPVELFGQQITERVAEVTWTGGEIGPGEFDEFGLSARVPDAPGTELVFPALQTYAGGEIVRWIGAADSDEPAPRVKLTAVAEQPAEEETAEAAPPPDDDDTRVNLALGLAVAGLVTGLAALALAVLRRPRRS